MLSRAELMNYCLTKSCLERQGLHLGAERSTQVQETPRRQEARSSGR